MVMGLHALDKIEVRELNYRDSLHHFSTPSRFSMKFLNLTDLYVFTSAYVFGSSCKYRLIGNLFIPHYHSLAVEA